MEFGDVVFGVFAVIWWGFCAFLGVVALRQRRERGLALEAAARSLGIPQTIGFFDDLSIRGEVDAVTIAARYVDPEEEPARVEYTLRLGTPMCMQPDAPATASGDPELDRAGAVIGDPVACAAIRDPEVRQRLLELPWFRLRVERMGVRLDVAFEDSVGEIPGRTRALLQLLVRLNTLVTSEAWMGLVGLQNSSRRSS